MAWNISSINQSEMSVTMKTLVMLLMVLLAANNLYATDFLDEDWDMGTPTGCWPCEELYCSDTFHDWYTDYGGVIPSAGVTTGQYYSSPNSFYNHKDADSTSGCAITYDFDTPYPTTIYLRFYMYMDSDWLDYPGEATGDPLIHWVFTNSQAGSTGFRLNLTTNDHWGGCPAGDVCLLPEGDGGYEWWDMDWTSGAADDFMQYVGAWHCFEYKMEISGDDLILTEYIDGVLTRGPITGPGQNTSSFNKIIFHLWDNPGGSYSMGYYVDDIKVSDSYIGPLSPGSTTATIQRATIQRGIFVGGD